MRRSPRSRETASLSDSVHHQLTMYALAASAVGVGVLALVQSAEAKIVYTPANIPINVGGGLVALDLNHDGINDFQFTDTFVVEKRQGRLPSDAFSFSYLGVAPVQKSNRVYAVKSDGQLCAAAVPKGRTVGPHSPFQPGDSSLVMAFGSNGGAASCPWRPVKTACLGVKFVIKGKVHFGWARIKRTAPMYAGFPAIITGYAYETIPDKPIITGKTKGPDEFKEFDSDPSASLTAPIADKPQSATLGALAMGSPGLSIWRREGSVSADPKPD
jgi:hypothetical protein